MKARVLVVEDDVGLASALGAKLESCGFDVTTVHDGVSALETLRMTDHDAVLLDLDLPRMSGTKFLHELRFEPNVPHTPVVLFTGSDEARIGPAAGHGVFAVHRKPTRASEIARTLRAAVHHG